MFVIEEILYDLINKKWIERSWHEKLIKYAWFPPRLVPPFENYTAYPCLCFPPPKVQKSGLLLTKKIIWSILYVKHTLVQQVSMFVCVFMYNIFCFNWFCKNNNCKLCYSNVSGTVQVLTYRRKSKFKKEN